MPVAIKHHHFPQKLLRFIPSKGPSDSSSDDAGSTWTLVAKFGGTVCDFLAFFIFFASRAGVSEIRALGADISGEVQVVGLSIRKDLFDISSKPC
jgi:hypothetical protein